MKTITFKPAPFAGAMLLAFASASWADSGSFNMHYTKNSPIPVGDQPGHIVYLGEASGTAKGGGKDGSQVQNQDYVDIINGNGEHQGYLTATKRDGKEIVKWAGKVHTTMAKNGTPNTSFRGNYVVVQGTGWFEPRLGKHGAYKGYFTSPTDYVINWQDQ